MNPFPVPTTPPSGHIVPFGGKPSQDAARAIEKAFASAPKPK